MQTFQLFFKHTHCYCIGLFGGLNSILQVGFSTGVTLGSAQILVGWNSSIAGRLNVWNDTNPFHSFRCFIVGSGDQTRFPTPFQLSTSFSKDHTELKAEFWQMMATTEGQL